MIKCLITKANNDYWYTFKTFNFFKDFISFIEKIECSLTVTENFWYKEDTEEIFNAWSKGNKTFTMKDAYSIANCKYEIIIENSEY